MNKFVVFVFVSLVSLTALPASTILANSPSLSLEFIADGGGNNVGGG